MLENLNILHEVVFTRSSSEFMQIRNFLLAFYSALASYFGRDYSELDISRKYDGDAYSII